LTLISGLFSLPLSRLPEGNGAPSRAEKGPSASIDIDHFLAGPENILVRILAATADAASLAANPIVLCGPSGVGKTALAHALAARRHQKLGLRSIIATTGPDFARSLACAIDSDSVMDLRARHQRCDLLLIDDFDRLASKPAAQQFLLSILDPLVRRGSLVIVTMRLLPQALKGLLPGLASRLAGGLIVPLAAPGLLARRELLKKLAARHDLELSDESLAKLAGEGAMVALTAPRLRHAILQLAAGQANGRATGIGKIAELVAAELPDAKAVIKQTTAAVAEQMQLTTGQLKGKSRQQAIADARGLAMFIARRLTRASYAEIGRHFGNRDHSTVLHACQKYERRVAQDNETRRLVAELTSQVAAGEGG
jgi:chromosomal replication initiator protein